jgi:hypothetical protein
MATDYDAVLSQLRQKAEQEGGLPVYVLENDQLDVAAKVLVGPPYHVIAYTLQYNPGKEFWQYRVAEEIVALRLKIIAARAGLTVPPFAITEDNRISFYADCQRYVREELGSESIDRSQPMQMTSYMSLISLVEDYVYGWMIEDELFQEDSLHPAQLLLIAEGMDDLLKDCDEERLSVLPPKARLALKVLVLSSAMYFRELYGYDRTAVLHTTDEEKALASEVYAFYRSTVSARKEGMRSSSVLFRYITRQLHIEDYFSEAGNRK